MAILDFNGLLVGAGMWCYNIKYRVNSMTKSLPAWIIFFFILGSGFFLPTWAEEDMIQSVWTDKAPKIDGSSDDWTGVTLTPWEKGRITCACRNSADTLYVLFVISDPKFRSTIEGTGITLYFSAEGKNKDHAIHFRKKMISAEEAIAIQEKQKPLTEEQKIQMRAQPTYSLYHSEVINKKAGSPAPALGFSGKPALFRYSPQQKSLVYEFIIPLPRAEEWAAGVGAEVGQTVMVGFEWGGMTEEMRKMAARRQGSGANIANERIGAATSDIVPDHLSGRVPQKHNYWGLLKLASGTS